MQFNQATDYAFRTMLHMGALASGTVVSTQQLAEEEKIPPRFLPKIMRALRQAGLICSYRGVAGGFALAKPADSITLLDIVEAMEGPVAIHRCLGERDACSKRCTSECPVHATLGRLQSELIAGLRQAKLTTLVAESRGPRKQTSSV